jgi:hypothetical protein
VCGYWNSFLFFSFHFICFLLWPISYSCRLEGMVDLRNVFVYMYVCIETAVVSVLSLFRLSSWSLLHPECILKDVNWNVRLCAVLPCFMF